MAIMPARIASGRSSQTAVTFASSGDRLLERGGSDQHGTAEGTSEVGVCPNSFVGILDAESGRRPPKPKVTGSNPVGDTDISLYCDASYAYLSTVESATLNPEFCGSLPQKG